MVEIATWFALGAVGMAVGTAILALGVRSVPSEHRRRYSVLVAVPFIALVAYVLMALGLGDVESQSGDPVYALRYLDWLLTTPLHILYLGLIAGATAGMLSRALGLMAATIVLGFVGAVFAPPLQWLGFLGGGAAFLGVMHYLYRGFDRSAGETDETTVAIFRKLRAFTVVLWLIYPVIWLVAPAGFGLMNVTTATLVVAYIDVVAKVGFGLIALSGQLTSTSAGVEAASPAD
jgi:sensory rhodopsin